jgi:starch phosphorylase
MGLDLEELIDEENDPGLGNGGLGRLAACFLDSWPRWGCQAAATVSATTTACSSKTSSTAGRWSHRTTGWSTVTRGNSSAIKPAIPCALADAFSMREKLALAGNRRDYCVAYDQIIPGYDTDATNTLRLWSAQASSEINLGKFNQGDYFAAVEDKNHSENVSRVLYPDDSTYSGRELRLRQEYFRFGDGAGHPHPPLPAVSNL